MSDRITKTIDGISFTIRKIPALTALRLDKQVIQLVLPVIKSLSGISNIDMDTDISKLNFSQFGNMFDVVAESLSKMPDENFQQFFLSLFDRVQAKKTGHQAVQLNDENSFDIFDSMLTIYKLAVEVMKYNKFSVFGLVVGGNVTTETNGSESEITDSKENSEKSEQSEILKMS